MYGVFPGGWGSDHLSLLATVLGLRFLRNAWDFYGIEIVDTALKWCTLDVRGESKKTRIYVRTTRQRKVLSIIRFSAANGKDPTLSLLGVKTRFKKSTHPRLAIED